VPKTFKSSFIIALYFVLVPIIFLSTAYTFAPILPTAAGFAFDIFCFSLLPAATIIGHAGWNMKFFTLGGGAIQIIPFSIGLSINFTVGFAIGLAVTETVSYIKSRSAKSPSVAP
jgi:hypothetical protein